LNHNFVAWEDIMDLNSDSIGPLKKVSLVYTVGRTPGSNDLIDTPKPLSFIFGLGVTGLTPFEYEIAGKQAGEGGVIPVHRQRVPAFFGHIMPWGLNLSGEVDLFYLRYKITGIENAESREVVKAMAEASACGTGCDCGCGSHK
jgi:hypothetical protein